MPNEINQTVKMEKNIISTSPAKCTLTPLCQGGHRSLFPTYDEIQIKSQTLLIVFIQLSAFILFMGKCQSSLSCQPNHAKGNPNRQELVLKVTIVGQQMVGKTALSQQYIKGVFPQLYKPSIGIGIGQDDLFGRNKYMKFHPCDSSRIFIYMPVVKIQLWDSIRDYKLGQRKLIHKALENANGIILMYKTNSQKSFEMIVDHWLPLIKEVYKQTLPKMLLFANRFPKEKIIKVHSVQLLLNQKVDQITRQNAMEFAQMSIRGKRCVDETLDAFFMKLLTEKIPRYEWKQVYMCFLLDINEDFDDDLLQDAVQLLVDM